MTQSEEEQIGRLENRVTELQNKLQTASEAIIINVDRLKKRRRSEEEVVAAIADEVAKRVRVENQASLAAFETRMRSLIEQSLKTAADEKKQLAKNQHEDEKEGLKEVLNSFIEENKKNLSEMENKMTAMIQNKAVPSQDRMSTTEETTEETNLRAHVKAQAERAQQIAKQAWKKNKEGISTAKFSLRSLVHSIGIPKPPIFIEVRTDTRKVLNISVLPSDTIYDIKMKL